jgi:hypothetical protein
MWVAQRTTAGVAGVASMASHAGGRFRLSDACGLPCWGGAGPELSQVAPLGQAGEGGAFRRRSCTQRRGQRQGLDMDVSRRCAASSLLVRRQRSRMSAISGRRRSKLPSPTSAPRQASRCTTQQPPWGGARREAMPMSAICLCFWDDRWRWPWRTTGREA